MALRNLSRQKRRSFLLGGALSFGMCILVLVSGLTGGLLQSLQKNFADMVAGHIFFLQVERDENDRLQTIIKDDQALLDSLEDSSLSIQNATRRTVVFGTVLFSGKGSSRQISGIDWKEDTQLAKSLRMQAGSADTMAGSDGILISTTLAELIGLLPKAKMSFAEQAVLRRDMKIAWRENGKKYDLDKAVKEEIKHIEQRRKEEQATLIPSLIGELLLVELSTINAQQNVAEFSIAGVFESHMDIAAYVDREALNRYIGMPEGTYNQFGLLLDDFTNLDAKTMMLHQRLSGTYELHPYADVAGRDVQTIITALDKTGFTGKRTIITNLNNELGSFVGILTGVQAGSFGLFLIILVVVMVGLVNTFRIVIYERTREIGTMRALGMQRAQIRSLFILEALFLAVAGCIPGTLVGFLLLSIASTFNLEAFAELGYFLDGGRLSWTISGITLVSSLCMVVFFTLCAAYFPARRAARLLPAQALRTQF